MLRTAESSGEDGVDETGEAASRREKSFYYYALPCLVYDSRGYINQVSDNHSLRRQGCLVSHSESAALPTRGTGRYREEQGGTEGLQGADRGLRGVVERSKGD
jgi:hypothetical protein